MSHFDEQDYLVRLFCKNTGVTHEVAWDTLRRNKWDLKSSYKEAEQKCVSGTYNTLPHSSQPQFIRKGPATVGRGGMEGGVGSAVTLDTRGVRTTAKGVFQPPQSSSVPQSPSMQGLKVALPPVTAPAERVIPIQVEGVRMMYQPQPSAVAPSTAMAQVTLNEKVLPCQPGMVPPKTSTTVSGGGGGSYKPESVQTQAHSSHSSDTCSKLKRGFSNIKENETLVSQARTSVLQDIREDNNYKMFMTFMLPDLTKYPEDFRAFLKKELIESSTLNSLQIAGRLNWWVDLGLCQRLIPMATTGDGNCLLHAASLAMWGIHDRLLTLRNALHDTLTKAPFRDNLYRRWRWQQTLVNQQSALVFSEAEWKAEWENILRLASPSPRTGPEQGTNLNSCCDSPITSSTSLVSDTVVYESLEEFHVFVLAHVLKRPIIVVADTILRDANGEALAPIPFGGIFLPLECNNNDCCSSPLLLTYDAAHFSALVPMQQNDPPSGHELSLPLAIPVVDPELKLLPLHFCSDPGSSFDWNTLNNKGLNNELCLEDRLNLLKVYMDIVLLPLSSDLPIINDTGFSSRQSSTGSDDGSGLNTGTLKDKKKDGKQNIMAKQFGSLGKSVGKKLKTLGNNLAPGKAGAKVDGEKGQQALLSGGLSQSTKVISTLATNSDGEPVEMVYCAKLSCKHEDTREVFINNYLKDAHCRFRQDQERKRQKGEDLRMQATAPQNSTCRTPGCGNYALVDLSLCDQCASQQQWQQGPMPGRPKGQGQQMGYNTFPGRYKAPTGLPHSTGTSDEIYKCGKSKFYAQSEPSPANSVLQVLCNTDRQQSMSTGNMAHPTPAGRPRSPSPDYDNLRYSQANPKCANAGCDFYGSKETGYLCSSCYRNRPQQPQLAMPEKTTRL